MDVNIGLIGIMKLRLSDESLKKLQNKVLVKHT